MKSIDTKTLVRTSIMTALVFITTYAVTIPLGFGYFNLGDAAVFLTGLVLGPRYAFLAAGIGSGLADYAKAYVFYIPSTFLLKGVMAFLASKAKDGPLVRLVAVMAVGGLIMVAGYYVTEGVLYGTWIAPLYNLPWNILQFSIGMAAAILIRKQLKHFR